MPYAWSLVFLFFELLLSLLLLLLLLRFEFFTPALADAFSVEFESPQVSRTPLSILADLNNAVV